MKTKMKAKSQSATLSGQKQLSSPRSLDRPNRNNGRSQAAAILQPAGESLTGYVRLIQIPLRENRVRAIGAWLRVPYARCRFEDNQFLVTPAHIEALEKAAIPFEDITDQT